MKHMKKNLPKLHKNHKRRNAFMGTLCLVLAFLMVISVYQKGEVLASGISGAPLLDSSSDFWQNRYIAQGTQFWQQLQVTSNLELSVEGNSTSSTMMTYDADSPSGGITCYITDFDDSFSLSQIETTGKAQNQSFSNLGVIQEGEGQRWVGTDKRFSIVTGDDGRYYYEYFNYVGRPAETVTYYRVITDSSSEAYLGDELSGYYQRIVGNSGRLNGYEVDAENLINTYDEYGQTILPLIEEFAQDLGLYKYSVGTDIELYQNDKH